MKAVIDRVEGKFAVVLLGEEETEIPIPIHILPAGVREGDWLDVNFTVDPQARKAQEKTVSELLEKLKSK